MAFLLAQTAAPAKDSAVTLDQRSRSEGQGARARCIRSRSRERYDDHPGAQLPVLAPRPRAA